MVRTMMLRIAFGFVLFMLLVSVSELVLADEASADTLASKHQDIGVNPTGHGYGYGDAYWNAVDLFVSVDNDSYSAMFYAPSTSDATQRVMYRAAYDSVSGTLYEDFSYSGHVVALGEPVHVLDPTASIPFSTPENGSQDVTVDSEAGTPPGHAPACADAVDTPTDAVCQAYDAEMHAEGYTLTERPNGKHLYIFGSRGA